MAANINHLANEPVDIRAMGNRRGNNEPLQRFTEAKKLMGDIYNDLGAYVEELENFYSSIEKDQQKFVPETKIMEVGRFKDSIATIKEMFSRDKMKVVFFGRTSNGKSSIINAMLHSRVLPHGMGHTTCCFLQVEGGPDNDVYYTTEGSDKKYSTDELERVGHALSSENIHLNSMGKDQLLKIFYPKSSSKLLQNDVVIVDSPGIDLDKVFDGWIDKHCLDADVFVLVCNAESILTQTEKDFFHRVSQKLPHPNIFILNNRWDMSNSEPEKRREQLRIQHQTRFVDFLVKELKVCSANDAKDRFFFISAREMLDARLKAKGEIEVAFQQEGFQRRQLEFLNFENHFEKCLSKSAIKTKFEAHSRRAREIIENMRYNLESVYNSALREKQHLSLYLQIKNQDFLTCRERFRQFEIKYQAEQKRVRAEVHLRVSADFYEEISRLESIFDRFRYDFGDEPHQIQEYKRKLAEYVGKYVTTDLENLCTGGLMARIWAMENDMFNNVKEICGEQFAGELDKFWRYNKPFKFTIAVDCPNMVRDFHEDLEFRFSLGIESIARRVLAMTRGQPITTIGQDVIDFHRVGADRQPQKNDVDNFIARVFVQSATYLANGSVGIALAGLIVYKNVDWRWIAGGAGLIGAMYTFERYKWNAGAKEQRLKDQFRSHLEQRLQQVEHVHTGQCEAQVVNELDKVYNGLQTVVYGIHREIKENIDATKKKMDKVDDVVKGLSSLKGKTNFVSSSLEAFATRYLKSDSPSP